MIKIKQLLLLVLLLSTFSQNNPVLAAAKVKIAVVDSYHATYPWSNGTNEGVLAALLDLGYIDNKSQFKTYVQNDHLETSKIILQRYWMNSKLANSQNQIASALNKISGKLELFEPDAVLLGDDNAANYFGNYYLDSDVPVVFWGVNGSPLKYGLLDSIENPGHNITGIYQASYHRESIEHLMKLVPGIKKIALLSDDSTTGRAHTKSFQASLVKGKIPLEVVKVVVTNSYPIWQQEALALKDKVDAFLISMHATMKDSAGQPVDTLEAAKWYLKNIKLPEAGTSVAFVKEGMLSCINDSPFKQGYEAVKVLHSILEENNSPANIAPYAPEHGGFVVNRWRASQLGISDNLEKHKDIINELIDEHVDIN